MYVCSGVMRRQISERLASCLSRRNLSYGPTRAITSKIFEKFQQNQQQNQLRMPTQTIPGPFASRFYSRKPPSNADGKPQSAANNDDDDDGNELVWSESDWSDDEYFTGSDRKTDLAVPNAVPDIFPRVPLIAVRYPIFPKFSKIIEVSDPKLIQRLEWCVASATPYAGVFVLKDSESESTVVTDLNQVHQVGTFIKIGEMERRGDKLHLIATGHRRIKITRAINKLNDKEPVIRVYDEGKTPAQSGPVKENEKEETTKEGYVNVKRPPVPPPTETPKADGPPSIHMVETENMKTSEVDKQSTEYKAITLEIVSTIRQIITENPFIQEAVKQMLGENLNVADNPAYLADLAAAITSARPAEQQQIMEEEDVIDCEYL